MNDFRASEGWSQKRLSLCRCTTQAQKTPEQGIDKVMLYILYVRQLEQITTTGLDCIIAVAEKPLLLAKGDYLHSFRAQLVQSIKDLLNKEKTDLIVIPGGATGHNQVADIMEQAYKRSTERNVWPVDG